ncbi:aspartic proteinase nepenthesin-1-like [Quercus robur]|uniref:aspartic proteinase nepenthesin-1-like n=1 Tax=Quercus robur TaxID=38942 RepID=UPI00216295DB|nr:aspartic proteinase nepenthesin-1-like [Quercus robur]
MAHYATSLQPLLLLPLLILILPLLTFSSRLAFDDNPLKTGFRVSLTHIDAGLKNLTKLQLIQRAIINRVKPRLEKLSAITKNGRIDNIRAPVYAGDEEFLMNLSIGTPVVPLVAIMDTGFGCGVNNQVIGMNNVVGIVGLGRGTLSFVSQLGSRKFSYCFTSIGDNKSSSLLFGSLADLNVSNGAIKSTPLIRNPILPSFYYLSLEGITVGQTLLPIPKSLFQIGSNGGGGLMIDSETTVTSLQEDAFDMLKQTFVAQTKLQVSYSYTTEFDLCFDLPSKNVKEIKFPRLVFHFKGLDLELPAEN